MSKRSAQRAKRAKAGGRASPERDPLISSGVDWSADSYDAVRAAHRWRIPQRFNIAHVCCDRHAGSGRIALIELAEDGRRTVHTFDELARWSSALAHGLAELGVERGDRVGVFLPQCVENPIAHLAILKLGAITVPLSPLFRSTALAHRLQQSETRVVITTRELSVHLPALDVVLTEDDFWRLADRSIAAKVADTSADDPAMLIYTSGTSGLPKGALHAHRFLPARLPGFEVMHRLETGPKDRPFWTPAEWAWVGGLVDCVLTPWVFGCPVLGVERRGFDPERAFRIIESEQVRSLFLPPTALNLLRRVEAPERFRLKVMSTHSAGEPLSDETYRWAARTFGTVYELYGMTEIGALIGTSPWVKTKPGAMGRPFPGHDVVLIEGEIAVPKSDPGMFLGYWNDPEGTAARFRNDRWMTGDVARQDDDGYYWYLGRNDDMFNTSGYRVGPTEIEACLDQHPAVLESAVVGEPDVERGSIVKAFVVLRADQQPSVGMAEALRDHVGASLAAFERPRRIAFVDHLPRTETGKIKRNELRRAEVDAHHV